jgi:hypothetical protein
MNSQEKCKNSNTVTICVAYGGVGVDGTFAGVEG